MIACLGIRMELHQLASDRYAASREGSEESHTGSNGVIMVCRAHACRRACASKYTEIGVEALDD